MFSSLIIPCTQYIVLKLKAHGGSERCAVPPVSRGCEGPPLRIFWRKKKDKVACETTEYITDTERLENNIAIKSARIKFRKYKSINQSMSLDSVVGIATGYGVHDLGAGVRIPVGSRIFTSPYRPDRLWGPSNLLTSGYRGGGGLFFLG
jgi:hypothetical protein